MCAHEFLAANNTIGGGGGEEVEEEVAHACRQQAEAVSFQHGLADFAVQASKHSDTARATDLQGWVGIRQ